ncbi:MAG: PKD domain-containing protein [Sphingobacteriia bacterium]|nr:PKD domain-containing protein [Sphingobacteriia bacterium]
MRGVVKKVGYILLLLIVHFVKAQSNLEFVENKGQWDKTISFKGDLNIGSFALKPDGGYRLLLYNQDDLAALSPHLSRFYSAKKTDSKTKKINDTANTTTLRGHVYEVKFLNANPNPQAIPDKALKTYNNYFIGNDSTKWASHCKVYQAVTYKNVYPNIDVRYYTANGSLKYDLIVNPGGNPDNIALYFDGADNLKVKSGELLIQTSVTEMKEAIPQSYILNNATRDEAECNYQVKGNIVRFKLKNQHDKNTTLVIDPQFVFCSFSGSSADNWGFTATYDNGGNFYLGGIVFGSGFPVSNGAFQTNFAGGSNTGEGKSFDIGIIKLDPGGVNRLFATYIGGSSGNEYPHSLVCDANNNLILSGRTSSSDYPGTLKGPGGGLDIILSKFSSDGSALTGSLRIGGKGDDGVNIKNKYPTNTQGFVGAVSTRRNYGDDSRSEVIVDNAGNIYLASCTQSTDFPTTANAFQTSNGGPNASGRTQDGVFIKTDPSLTNLICSTYLGGSDDDAPFVLAINPSNSNIYIAGATASSDLPGNRGGSLFQNNQGQVDGFVSIIANNTYQLLQTSYWGTLGIDIIYGIQFDKFGFPYIMGTTTGAWPVVNAVYNVAGAKQFIAKLKPDLSGWVYSTTFGTANSVVPNISPTAFLIDRCEQAYVSGWGGLADNATELGYPNAGTKGLPITPDATQSTTDGSDFYFFVLGKNASGQIYGSFFGQNGGNYPDHVDGGTSRFDKNGVIYQGVCANCGGGAVFPTGPPGVWSPTNRALPSGCNMAGIKIAFNLAGLQAELKSRIEGSTRDTSGCLPLMVAFKDSIGDGKQYIWNYGDGSKYDTTTTSSVTHIFNSVGRFKVSMIAIDSNTCNVRDTSYVTIKVGSDSVSLSLQSKKLLPCTQLNYAFTNNSFLVNSLKQFGDSSFVIDFGDKSPLKYLKKGETVFTHAFPAEGTYYVKLTLLDTNFCNFDDYVIDTLRIASNLKAAFTTPAKGCIPYTAVFNNQSNGGQQFFWDFGDGSTSTVSNPTHVYNNVGTYSVKLIAIDSGTCNIIDSAIQVITTSGKPTAAFTATPQPPVANTAINFINNSTGGTLFKFFFGDLDSVITTSVTQPVSHIYNQTNTYKACLYAYNASGCFDVTCQLVSALINPLFDVPNAFSPNGDGINDKIYVRGYGIATMKWSIYNRWGTLVYQSSDKSSGWDGTYLGKVQPQDVYHYVLEVELSDGGKFTKKGDITLLR